MQLTECMDLYEYQRLRSFTDLGPRSLRFTCLNFFSVETARFIEAKFHMKPPWDGEMKVYSNGLGHMTDMAAMLIYGKNHKKIFFSRTKQPMTLKVGMRHRVLEYYQICSNDDPGLTLTYFTARSNLVPYAFV